MLAVPASPGKAVKSILVSHGVFARYPEIGKGGRRYFESCAIYEIEIRLPLPPAVARFLPIARDSRTSVVYANTVNVLLRNTLGAPAV